MSKQAKYHEIVGGYTDPLEDDVASTRHGALSTLPNNIGDRYVRGRNAGSKRDLISQAQLKAGIAGLWRDGVEYKEIAKRVSDQYGVTIGYDAVKYHVKSMLTYWRRLSMTRIDERQAMMLARLDQIEQLAIQGFFRSMDGKETHLTEKQVERARKQENKEELQKRIRKERKDLERARKGGEQVEIPFNEDGALFDNLIVMSEKVKDYLRTETAHAGDPKWLSIMLEVSKQRAQLWGIWNRKEAESDDQSLVRLTDEDRYKRMAAILDTVAQRRTQDVGALAPAAPLGGFTDDKEPEDAGPVLEGAFFDDLAALPDPEPDDDEEIEDDEEW